MLQSSPHTVIWRSILQCRVCPKGHKRFNVSVYACRQIKCSARIRILNLAKLYAVMMWKFVNAW